MTNPLDRLPQRGPARLIVRVDEAGPESGRCTARIAADHPAAEGGHVPASVVLELGAQAAAALAAAGEVPPDAEAEPGRVVTARDVRLDAALVAVETDLTVRVRLVEEAPPLRTYAFEIPGAGSGRVGVWTG